MMQQAHFDTSEICWRNGVRHAVFSPGSRNAPLSISFARNPKVKTYVSVDERSAGFIALGISLTTKEPVVLCCTSGTALLNYLPAIAEAWYQEVPLIILSADRPSEWIDQWDGQTIRQNGVFTSYIKSHYNQPEETLSPDSYWHYTKNLINAIQEATTGRKAPVHINVPIREPFYPQPSKEYSFTNSIPIREKREIKHDSGNFSPVQNSLTGISNLLIVLGHGESSLEEQKALQDFIHLHKIVVVADSISNFSILEEVISHHDSFSYTNDLVPDLLITFGKSLISKNLKLFLRKHKPKHFHISENLETSDPFQTYPIWCQGNLLSFIRWFSSTSQPLSDYVTKWKTEEQRVVNKIATFNASKFNEFSAFASVVSQLPEDSYVHVANSMAVRYVNMVGLPKHNLIIRANRGTSGIEGSNGTALGNSLVTEKLVILLTGDLAFLYDTNAFWTENLPSNLRIIVFNNSGGGIFGLIPGPSSLPPDEFSRFFLTPHNRNIQSITEELRFGYRKASNFDELQQNLQWLYRSAKQASLLEIQTDFSINHKEFSHFKEYIQ